MRDADGTVVAGIGFTQDVTEARQTEAALRESEQRNKLTFLHAPVGKAIVDLEGHWLQVNAAVVELTGYPEDQLLTMTFQDITHPDDLQLDLDHLARLLAGELTSYRIEKRYVTASGRIVHVLLAVSLVRAEDGTPLYFIAQIQDITELVTQRQALKDLTSMLSHDLRTATTVVSGFSEMLLTSWSTLSDEEREQYL
ncbi:MAG: PAS domain S-box protein, partial [Microbacterium sp.]